MAKLWGKDQSFRDTVGSGIISSLHPHESGGAPSLTLDDDRAIAQVPVASRGHTRNDFNAFDALGWDLSKVNSTESAFSGIGCLTFIATEISYWNG